MRQLLMRRVTASLGLVDSLDGRAQLPTQVYFGYFLGETGRCKVHNLDALAQRFIGWGTASVPMAP